MMASQENKRHSFMPFVFSSKDDPKVWTSSFEWGEEYICGLIMKMKRSSI
ncbi:hypothetical protein B4107_1403 [Bacillus safensis]|nr:hypothetical protein B4107_1403 [Bacillus safensis]